MLEWPVSDSFSVIASGVLCAKRGEEGVEACQSLIMKLAASTTAEAPDGDTVFAVELFSEIRLIVEVSEILQVSPDVVEPRQVVKDKLNC